MRLKFITLNLWKGGELWESILRFLDKEKPDILVAQEVYNGSENKWPPRLRSVDLITNELAFSHVRFDGTRREQHDMGMIENGNAVFSKLPIIEARNRFFDVPYDENYVENFGDYTHVPRAMQLVTIGEGKPLIHIANVHGIWGKDGKDSPRRLAMGKAVAEEIAGKQPLLLAGDFNMEAGTESIDVIEAQAPNVFKGELTSSFNMRRKSNPGYATAVVDMVFATPDVNVTAHYMPDVDVSDHMPLVVEIEL